MKTVIALLIALALIVTVVWSQTTPQPLGLAWDANTEADLAGYYVYEARTADGQVVGEYMVSVPAPLTSFDFPPDSHTDGEYYWKITAYDTAGNESAFSNQVNAAFNVDPPAPPSGCAVRF